jgi:hypothetical protein
MVVVVPMVVMVLIVIIPVVTVRMAVPAFVIFVVPVSFLIPPAFRRLDVIRTRPICSREGRLLVMAGNPTIVVSMWDPEALYPYHRGCRRRRWRRLILNRWRRDSDIDRNLPGCRYSQRCYKKESADPSVLHADLRSTLRRAITSTT